MRLWEHKNNGERKHNVGVYLRPVIASINLSSIVVQPSQFFSQFWKLCTFNPIICILKWENNNYMKIMINNYVFVLYIIHKSPWCILIIRERRWCFQSKFVWEYLFLMRNQKVNNKVLFALLKIILMNLLDLFSSRYIKPRIPQFQLQFEVSYISTLYFEFHEFSTLWGTRREVKFRKSFVKSWRFQIYPSSSYHPAKLFIPHNDEGKSEIVLFTLRIYDNDDVMISRIITTTELEIINFKLSEKLVVMIYIYIENKHSKF